MVARQFWEHASATFSHIKYNGSYLRSEDQLMGAWRVRWLDRWSANPHASWLRGKRVGEWGVGGGLLGKMLCEQYRIGRYVAFDIAERQLQQTKARLAPTSCAHEVVLASSTTAPGGCDWQRWRLDALISQQVIQHFPTEQYTVQWLCTLAAARIPRLLLEVRLPPLKNHKRHALGFGNWALDKRLQSVYELRGLVSGQKSTIAVQFATYLDCNYLLGRLPGYRLDWFQNHTKLQFSACALSLKE